MKIFILTTDDDDGLQTGLFPTETERDTALLAWVDSNPEEFAKSPLRDDLHEYVQSRTDYLDTFSTDEQELL